MLGKADSWTIASGDAMPVGASDADRAAVDAMRAHHKARFSEVDGCVTEGATCVTDDAIAVVGRSGELVARGGGRGADVVATAKWLDNCVWGSAPDSGTTAVTEGGTGETV